MHKEITFFIEPQDINNYECYVCVCENEINFTRQFFMFPFLKIKVIG